MTSLRFVLLFAVLLSACSDPASTPPASDAATSDAVVETSADSADAGCPFATATSVNCTGEDRAIGRPTFDSAWTGCADGKTYVMNCSVEGSDGKRDCVCKAGTTPLASFRAVTPDVNSVGGGSGWSEFWACYCGVRP